MALLWMAYQVVDQAASFFLSNLSLGSSTPREQQVMEIWVPFILAHLAGPDNITGYSLEDNKLSPRFYFNVPWQFFKIILQISKQFKVVTSRGALFWASLVMITVGACKYAEKVAAFREADFGNIGSSRKKKPERLQIHGHMHGRRKVLGNEQALLLAHQLLDITISAFADKFYLSTKEVEQLKQDTNLKDVFFVDRPANRLGWKNMCKVVEMELSLMYDILYTKAAVIHKDHDWSGFAIRVISPVVTATVIVLFWLTGSNDGQRTADVIITCILLSVTFLLDVRWLLGAAASTWTYTFFSSIPCLRHQVCCRGWWRRLRRFVESLDTWRLLPCLRMHGGGYRLWSGIMGQYNLFHESNQQAKGGTAICRLWSTLRSSLREMLKSVKLEDVFDEWTYCSRLKLHESSNDDVKKLLFKQIQMAFKMYMEPREPMAKKEAEEKKKEKTEEKKVSMVEAYKRRRELDEELDFLPEFQEAILIWHVATDVFLSCSSYAGQFCCADEQWKKVKAIRAVSDYLAFLAVVRRDMMPGLKLSSVHQATRKTLEGLWGKAGGDRERLICKLKDMEGKNGKSTWFHNGETMQRSALYDKSPVLSDGVKFAFLLSERPVTLTPEDWEKTLEVVLTEGIKSYYCSKWCESPSGEQEDCENKGYYSSRWCESPSAEQEHCQNKGYYSSKWCESRSAEQEHCQNKVKELPGVGKSNSRKRFEFLIPDLEDKAWPLDMKTLLDILLKSWVRLLIYISVRCGRDAHAKQLGRGGELTTIVWILSEHATIFAPKPPMENNQTTHDVCCAALGCL
ncbi:hypothetical protein U9M48_000864 [Paspalum notatum var. saurae]|uniref:DUF4220 domain-containing protein n=1 Tax=Paspalum notatum var. saurae TaxID=547442 RepID=A0AAQ3SHP9_PASNO